jgi:hypothetical protein
MKEANNRVGLTHYKSRLTEVYWHRQYKKKGLKIVGLNHMYGWVRKQIRWAHKTNQLSKTLKSWLYQTT